MTKTTRYYEGIEDTETRQSHPVGSRIRRVAKVRRATAERMTIGREKATAALLEAAKRRAFPIRMPSVHTVRGIRDRVTEWALNTAAEIVARKIERSTFKAAVNRLESLKIGGRDFKIGIWTFVNVMKGNIAV